MFDLHKYYLSLSEEERVKFSRMVGVSPSYMENHLIRAKNMPREKTINGIVWALDGKYSSTVVKNYFLRKLKKGRFKDEKDNNA